MTNLELASLKFRDENTRRVRSYKYLGKIIEQNLGHELHLER